MEDRKISRKQLVREFAERFGGTDGAFLAVSPGRVNLIGEHTDYNGGPVMPIAIDMCVEMVFRRRQDRRIVLFSQKTDESVDFSLDEMESVKKGWGAYPAGVCFMLREAGVEPCGMEGLVGGTLPIGTGLSSSAALETAAAAAQTHLTSAKIPRLEIARICQKAEHEFAGVKCGIMDQFAAVVGSSNGPVYLDCRTMEHKEFPLQENIAVVLCDTRVKHSLGTSEYNKRRAECEEAFSLLAEHIKGVECLAQVPLGEFRALCRRLPPVAAKRAEHVITETKRTRETAKALAASNPLQVGVLMNASHVSLRDNYEVSCAELDALAEAAWEVPGVYGSRMTGGGFGGCTVTLVDAARVDKLKEDVTKAYREAFKKKPDIYVCRPQRGVYVTNVGDNAKED